MHLRPWVPVVSLTKGLEQGTRLRMTEVVNEVLPGHPYGVLTGPNLAKEILAGDAAAAGAGHERPHHRRDAAGRCSPPTCSASTPTPTSSAARSAGALKNVMAIASGMADGLGTGDNTRAAVITRGLAELTRLGVAMGGDAVDLRGPGRHGRPDRHLHLARRAATATSASSSARAARSTRSSTRCTWWPRA